MKLLHLMLGNSSRKRLYPKFLLLTLLFFVAFGSGAKTFVFKPTKPQSFYSDTANWENREYPGRYIVEGDTVRFQINAVYHKAIIDSNILVHGFCQIGDSVNWVIPVGVTATFQRGLNDGMVLQKVISSGTSFLQIHGVLQLYVCHANFEGNTNVTGKITADAEYDPVAGLWQTAAFGDLTVEGTFTGTAVGMYCDSLFVNVGGRVAISSGYAFNNGKLHADTVINLGKISLENETQLHCAFLQNVGTCKAGSLAGKLLNTGTIELQQHPANSFTANIWDVENSGIVQIYGSVYAPIFINGVHNNGVFKVGDFLNEASLSSWLTINGVIVNNNLWEQVGSLAGAEMNGEFNNTDTFSLKGKTIFQNGYFTNNGTCQFYNPTGENGVLIANSFTNNGNFISYGRLQVAGQFLNYGNVNMHE